MKNDKSTINLPSTKITFTAITTTTKSIQGGPGGEVLARQANLSCVEALRVRNSVSVGVARSPSCC